MPLELNVSGADKKNLPERATRRHEKERAVAAPGERDGLQVKEAGASAGHLALSGDARGPAPRKNTRPSESSLDSPIGQGKGRTSRARKRNTRRDIWEIRHTWLEAPTPNAGVSEVGTGENLKGPENHEGGYTSQANLRGKCKLMSTKAPEGSQTPIRPGNVGPPPPPQVERQK